MTRHNVIKKYMREKKLDAVLLSRTDSIYWYFEGEVDPRIDQTHERGSFSLLLTQDTVGILCPKYELERLKSEIIPPGVEFYSHGEYESYERLVCRICKPLQRVATDDLALIEEKFQPLDDVFYLNMLELNAREIMRLRVIGKLSESILCEFTQEFRSGMAEIEIEKVLRAILIESGLEVPLLCVASDERIEKYPRPVSTSKKVEKYIMVKANIQKQGLRVNFTRYFYFGKVPPEIEKSHEQVSGVFSKAVVALMKARSLGEVYEEIKRAYIELGMVDQLGFYPFGSPVGYNRVKFLIRENSSIPIKSPTSYILNPWLNGTFSEDTVLLKANGTAEFLTLGEDFPKIKVKLDNFRVHRPWIMSI